MKFRPLALILALCLCACNSTTAPASAPTDGEGSLKPNVLLITVDALGWNDLDCYGSPLTETPNLDRLARQGVQFTQGYAASPLADETYRALQTGWHPARDVVGEYLGEKARAAGYFTASVGRNDGAEAYDVALGADLPHRPGSWYSAVGERDSVVYLPEYLTEESLRILRSWRGAKWLLTLRYPAPTEPLSPPEYWSDYYARKISATHYRPYPAPDYAAMVSSLDEQIGRLMDYLRQTGELANTFVLFTANGGGTVDAGRDPDRAYPTRNGILRGGYPSLYEGGLRVPFIVYFPPATRQPAANTSPVVATDVVPTLETYFGRLDYSPAPDGRALQPLLAGADVAERTHYWALDGYWAVRRGDVKMIYDPEADTAVHFNLAHRPDERKPLPDARVADDLRDSLRRSGLKRQGGG